MILCQDIQTPSSSGTAVVCTYPLPLQTTAILSAITTPPH